MILPAKPTYSPDGLLGRIVEGRYRLIRFVGAGRWATVFEAEHLHLPRFFALKFLTPALRMQPGMLERFDKEARAASRLKHPHIVEVVDFGTDPELGAYLCMEFLEGQTLQQRLNPIKRFPLPALLNIAAQMCDAFVYAHAQGVVHRDLKPANVMLMDADTQFDFVKVLDFGIAGVLGEGNPHFAVPAMALGTPSYMSPEQTRSEAVDHRSDIYALGIVLYLLATGQLPFQSDSPLETMAMHCELAPKPPSQVDSALPIARPLERLILRCLEKTPARRFQSMSEIKAQLQALAAQPELLHVAAIQAAPAAAASKPRPIATPSARQTTVAHSPNRTAWLLLVAVLMATVLAGLVVLVSGLSVRI